MNAGTTNSKSTILTVLKWIGASIFLLSFLMALIKDFAVISALLFLLGGLILLPPMSAFWQSKVKLLSNRPVKVILLLMLFVAGFVTNPNAGKHSARNETTKSGSAYQAYIDQTEKNINGLSQERKTQREKMYGELKGNPIYLSLVEQKEVSTEYLPVLHAIANGISHTVTDQFSIDEELMKQIGASTNGSDKTRFVAVVVALAGKANGGVPNEVIEVFERYKNAYRMYGSKGSVVVTASGQQTTIPNDFDLSPFFGMVDPKNPEVLNSIYEAKQKKLSSWPNTQHPTFPHLASKTGYMNHVRSVYPDSPYLLNVDYEVTASQLYASYDGNEVAADEKYKGKKLAVTGIVGNISKGIFDEAIVSLEIGFLQNINCDFGDNTKAVSRLSKGDRITIIGKCEGFILSQVILGDCEVWQ